MNALLAVLATLVSLLSPPAAPDASPSAVRVLRAWDERRAEAWARGDPALLRPLYTAGSRTGRRDRAMLAAYAGRGLRVPGLAFQLLAVDVVARGDGWWVLRVSDRMLPTRAVGRGGRWPLPGDRISTRLVALRRVAGEWRVVEAGRP